MAKLDGGGGATTIIVAVIGVIGVLGAALIAKISLTPPQNTVTNVASNTDPKSLPPTNTSATTPNSLESPTPPSAPSVPASDSAALTAISPSIGSTLPLASGSAITIAVHYKLISASHMLLVPSAEYYPDSRDCTGSHQTIGTNDPEEIPLKGGEGDTQAVLNIATNPGLKGAALTSTGSVSARASFWSGFDSQNRVIVNVEELWDPKTTCFHLG